MPLTWQTFPPPPSKVGKFVRQLLLFTWGAESENPWRFTRWRKWIHYHWLVISSISSGILLPIKKSKKTVYLHILTSIETSFLHSSETAFQTVTQMNILFRETTFALRHTFLARDTIQRFFKPHQLYDKETYFIYSWTTRTFATRWAF